MRHRQKNDHTNEHSYGRICRNTDEKNDGFFDGFLWSSGAFFVRNI